MATIRSAQPASTALPAKQRPWTIGDPRHQAGELRPEREGAGVEGGDDGVVGVAGPPSPALGVEDDGEPHPLDQLEEAVLLAVAEGALGPGQDRVVVGEDRAGGALGREEVAVDAGGAADQAVGGGAGDQVVELAAAALGGDRVAAVLDEGAGVDQVGEVLARRAPAGGVPLLAPRRAAPRPRSVPAAPAAPLGHFSPPQAPPDLKTARVRAWVALPKHSKASAASEFWKGRPGLLSRRTAWRGGASPWH